MMNIANDDDNNNTKYNNELSRLDQTGKLYKNLGVFFSTSVLLLFVIR